MGFNMEEVDEMHTKPAEISIFITLEGVYEWDLGSIRVATLAAGGCLL